MTTRIEPGCGAGKLFLLCSHGEARNHFMDARLTEPDDVDAVSDGPPAITAERSRGRGAASNRSGRFEPLAREAADDGWNSLDLLPPFRTEVQEETPRKIITRNES